MIGKVIRGWDGERLVRYLMSKGKYNEHTRPTVIAAWQNDPDALQPQRIGPGDFDFGPGEIGKLARHVNAAADALGLPTEPPQSGEPFFTKLGYIWHLPVAIEAGDGELDFATWRAIAEDMMNETGIAPYGDAGACRWIAVHHGTSAGGNDHIHIAAVLVRQDTGKRFHPHFDKKATRRVAKRWENKLGLRMTTAADSPAPTPTRGEQEKAKRRHAAGDDGMLRAEPGAATRVQLRQVITETAAIATTPTDFLDRLRAVGVQINLRRDDIGRIVGWSVAAPGDVSAKTGKPIWWAPSRHLGTDLSWPKLTARWTTPTPRSSTARARPQPHTVLTDSAARVRVATEAVRTRRADIPPIARELQDVIAAWAAVADGADRRGPLSRAAWAADRTTHTRRWLPPVPAGQIAAELRRVTRELAEVRMLTGRGLQRDASLQLSLAVAELLLEIAAWHQQNARLTAARHAGDAAAYIREHGEHAHSHAPSPHRPPIATPTSTQAPAPTIPARQHTLPAAEPVDRPSQPNRELPAPLRKDHR